MPTEISESVAWQAEPKPGESGKAGNAGKEEVPWR